MAKHDDSAVFVLGYLEGNVVSIGVCNDQGARFVKPFTFSYVLCFARRGWMYGLMAEGAKSLISYTLVTLRPVLLIKVSGLQRPRVRLPTTFL